MEILFEVKNSTGVITLNRPKALNALNLNMAIQLSKKLKEWEDDNAVERVILLGEGNHFCAGGDVKSVHLSGPFSELKPIHKLCSLSSIKSFCNTIYFLNIF